MSLVPSTYRCCQPRAELAVSGKAAAPRLVRQSGGAPAGPAPGSQASGQPDSPRGITKYSFYRNKRELTAAAIRRERAAGHRTNTTPRS
jgi:hypothetical protein